MNRMDPAVEAAAEALSAVTTLAPHELIEDATAAVEAARPHVEADLLARLTGDKAIGAAQVRVGMDGLVVSSSQARDFMAAAVRAVQEDRQ